MTMTDRELLEFAAKAAGIEYDEYHSLGCYLSNWEMTPDGSRYWNPLTNDGDALRLAVRLGLDVEMHGCKTTTPFACAFDCMRNIAEEVEAGDDGDPYAATRRAIVRAAAKIGSAI